MSQVSGLSNISARFKTHYDRIIVLVVFLLLLASLLYLAVQVGLISSRHEEFEAEIGRLVPKHPDATGVDTAPFENADRELKNPLLIDYTSWAGRSVFVPEVRVWCTHCSRPILFDAEVCSFCGSQQPNEDYIDGDKDGMPDTWERANGMNPFDSSDANADADDDDFSNLAEYQAGTDPQDETDFPPFEKLLFVQRIKSRPFELQFKSASELPDGSFKFGLNLLRGGRTYFVKMNESIGDSGFTPVKYEYIQAPPEERSGLRRDVSELTLKRGDELITLVKNRNVKYPSYTVTFVFALDGSSFDAGVNDTFELKGGEYQLIAVDNDSYSVVIIRLSDKEKFTVNRAPTRGTE